MAEEKKILSVNIGDNLNSKVGSSFVIHIGKPWIKKPIGEHTFDEIICLKAGEIGAEYAFYDYHEQRLDEIPFHICFVSHGMQRKEFFDYMYEKHSMHPEQTAGVYFFWKVKK